jgi:N-terminal domain of toast_rack, DUF2154
LPAILLMSVACGNTGIKTGPTVTENIAIGLSDTSSTINLELALGVGELFIQPGAKGNLLVQGTATYNVKEFKPKGNTLLDGVRFEQGNIGTILNPTDAAKVKNTWDLKLGPAPIALKIEAGASQANLTGLADLNLSALTLKGDTGDLTLDFGGKPQHDISAIISTNRGHVTIIVPEGAAAQATVTGDPNSVEARDDWQRSGNTYTLEGQGSKISLDINLGTGNLVLRNQ